MIASITPFGFSKQKLKEMNALTKFFLLALSVTFQGWSSHAKNPPADKLKSSQPIFNDHFGSSVYRKAIGNVYPLGYYSAKLNIGSPPNLFEFDIDTGSDLTWVQCELDRPCTGCTKPRDELYKPKKENIVHCSDPLCATLNWPEPPICESPDGRCGYRIEYADGASSHGVLVTDIFPIDLINGSLFRVRLALGCGYDLDKAPETDGILGLSKGRISILSQLGAIGLVNNVTGLCISGKGGGFLFLGDGFVPYPKVSWTQMLQSPYDTHCEMGPAELLFGGKSVGLTDLRLTFDSGSTYTYFTEPVYNKIVHLISTDLPLERTKDEALSICWKGPFESIRDVKKYFKPLALIFTNPTRVRLYLPPKAYLIITVDKNACLGIRNLNDDEVETEDINIIGDISMQDKMVIFDYVKHRIGWVSTDCNLGFRPLKHSL